MLHIFHGQDDYSINQELTRLKNEAGDSLGFGDSSTVLEGARLTVGELKNACETLPFLSGTRLVMVNGLLGRFTPKRQPRQTGNARRKSSQPDRHLEFVECLSNVPLTTDLILVESELKSANPLYKEIAGKATVKSFPPLREPQLSDWVQKRVAGQGGSISLRTAGVLARLIGSDLWVMANEVDKLTLYAAGRSIGEDDITALVSYTQETSVFTLVDAIMEQKPVKAEQLLQQMLESGAAPAYLMTMITRQFQLILRAGEMKKQRLTTGEIQTRLAIKSDFALNKVMDQATRYTLPRLREIYHQLLESDLSVKTGKTEAELALTILAAELCQQSKAAAR